MSKIWSVITNPFLLGVEGFVIGAALLWSTGEVPQAMQPAGASSSSLIAPMVQASAS